MKITNHKNKYYSLITIILIVVFFEILLRVLFSNEVFLAKLRSNDSAYRRITWVDRQNNRPHISPIHQFDPTVGWTYKSNLKDVNYLEDPSRLLTTNNDGFRNLFEFSSRDKEIIFMIGDSFTFGEEVGDKENYTYLLNKKFKNKTFYNLGVNGYGYDQMLLILKKYIGEFHPKTIILSFNFTDLDRALLSFHDYFKPYYTLADDELLLHTDHILDVQDALDDEKYHLKLLDFLRIIKSNYFFDRVAYYNEKILINEKIIKEMAEVATENGAKLVLFYQAISIFWI